MSGRVAAVEDRVGLDAGVDAIVLEVPDENVPYVLKTAGVGPFETGIFRRYKLQCCDSRLLAGEPSAAFEQFDVKKSFEIQVVGHRRVDVLQIVPIFQPRHYFPVIFEFLCYLAILETQASQKGAFSVQQSLLTSKDTGCEIVFVHKIADLHRQAVVVSVGYDLLTYCGIYSQFSRSACHRRVSRLFA